MNLDQRLYIERSLAAEISKRDQSKTDHSEWEASGFTFRVLAHYDKIFVVWRHTLRGPQILGKLRVINFDACISSGLGAAIETDTTDSGEGVQWVGHSPARLFDLPVFAHVPFISEVTYAPEARNPEKYVIKFPLVFKTASNPNSPIAGDIYVTQIGEFRGQYPEFADLKL